MTGWTAADVGVILVVSVFCCDVFVMLCVLLLVVSLGTHKSRIHSAVSGEPTADGLVAKMFNLGRGALLRFCELCFSPLNALEKIDMLG